MALRLEASEDLFTQMCAAWTGMAISAGSGLSVSLSLNMDSPVVSFCFFPEKKKISFSEIKLLIWQLNSSLHSKSKPFKEV